MLHRTVHWVVDGTTPNSLGWNNQCSPIGRVPLSFIGLKKCTMSQLIRIATGSWARRFGRFWKYINFDIIHFSWVHHSGDDVELSNELQFKLSVYKILKKTPMIIGFFFMKSKMLHSGFFL